MRDDSLLPADQTAALDEAFVLVDRERDVDSLAVADAAHVDEAVPDRHGSATDVDSVELGAVLSVGETKPWEDGVAEDLCEEPRRSEQGERDRKRRADVEGDDDCHHDAELERAERERGPAGLVRKERVVSEIERHRHREHRRRERDGPPLLGRGRDGKRRSKRRRERGDSGLDATSQRVRHLRRKACAAYRAPISVSAAGYAHWACTPARASVRVSSVRDGTVESRSRTIHRSFVASPCSSTSLDRSGSCRYPRRKPVAQMTCSAPFTAASTLKRPFASACASGSSHSRPGGYEGARSSRKRAVRRSGDSR